MTAAIEHQERTLFPEPPPALPGEVWHGHVARGPLAAEGNAWHLSWFALDADGNAYWWCDNRRGSPWWLRLTREDEIRRVRDAASAKAKI